MYVTRRSLTRQNWMLMTSQVLAANSSKAQTSARLTRCCHGLTKLARTTPRILLSCMSSKRSKSCLHQKQSIKSIDTNWPLQMHWLPSDTPVSSCQIALKLIIRPKRSSLVCWTRYRRAGLTLEHPQWLLCKGGLRSSENRWLILKKKTELLQMTLNRRLEKLQVET